MLSQFIWYQSYGTCKKPIQAAGTRRNWELATVVVEALAVEKGSQCWARCGALARTCQCHPCDVEAMLLSR